MRNRMPSGWLGCIHCAVSCTTLMLLFSYWSGSTVVIWNLDAVAKFLMLAGFYLSWMGLFYSIYLIGAGYQTGATQRWYWWIRSQPPRRVFITRSIYGILRHPIYLSFLGLIWFTPRMSLDHAVLTLTWSAYIFFGSILKDKRLLHYVGAPYRKYAARVAGFPGIKFGLLSKWPESSSGHEQPTMQAAPTSHQQLPAEACKP